MTEPATPSDNGICDLCERDPVAEDDVLCAACRQLVYEVSEVVTDPLEKLINQHGLMYPLLRFDVVRCYCGEEWKGGAGHHRHHLAEVICEHLGLPAPSPWMPLPEYEALQDAFCATHCGPPFTPEGEHAIDCGLYDREGREPVAWHQDHTGEWNEGDV